MNYIYCKSAYVSQHYAMNIDESVAQDYADKMNSRYNFSQSVDITVDVIVDCLKHGQEAQYGHIVLTNIVTGSQHQLYQIITSWLEMDVWQCYNDEEIIDVETSLEECD